MGQETIVVGLSGGVDSSVAAYLLKQQGYHVIGVTIDMWGKDAAVSDTVKGAAASAVEDARRVAEQLGIVHHVVDMHHEFRTAVMDGFVEEYLRGRTPNPCIICNRHVKWEALMRCRDELGAAYAATGHYARVEKLPNGRYAVCNAASAAKDQTYALCRLTQEQLSGTQMPVGEYSKEEIRSFAVELSLSVAHKKDSQDICFIPDNDYGSFLAREAGERMPGEGNFVLTDGTVVGRHRGISHYTVGQRKGLGIALGSPVFVKKIDVEANEVVLGEAHEVFADHLYADSLNLMGAEDFWDGQEFLGKIRYSHQGTPCRLLRTGTDEIRLDFAEPVRAVTPGQAVVLYQGPYVAGSATILR